MPNATDLANAGALKYNDLTDEHIKFIKKDIEVYIRSNEFFDKFCAHARVPRGHKEFTYRKLIKPKVKPEDIRTRAELVAPRPSKFAVATFTKTVANYGEKFIYTREDLQYHFDDTVKAGGTTLSEMAVQELDLIKGREFFKSRAVVSYDTSLVKTFDKAAIILRKNEAKRWANGFYLALITPEILMNLRDELRADGTKMPEKIKVEINGKLEELDNYGDFMFEVGTSPLFYSADGTKQYIVMLGKRNIDGESPIMVSKLEGEENIEVINNGLGNGILIDEDGHYTADDNKQQGAIALNMDGLGAAISDDLCILNCEVTLAEIKGIVMDIAEKTGYVSTSPASTLVINAVNSSGSAVASPTIEIRKKSSSGTLVSASNGAYPVVAGDTYYYSVGKTNYTTVTGTLVANAGANYLTVVLPAS